MKRIKHILTLSFFISLGLNVFAQPEPPGDPCPEFPESCIPIDQGDFLIVCVGLIFAAFFLLRKTSKAIN